MTEKTIEVGDVDVPADATAETLRKLAERYEVREFLTYGDQRKPGSENRAEVIAVERAAWPYVNAQDGETHGAIKDRMADHLHRVGWNPGMTAEDAARLLAEAA